MLIKTIVCTESPELVLLCFLLLALSACSRKDTSPPVAEIIPHDVGVQGEKLIDNYF